MTERATAEIELRLRPDRAPAALGRSAHTIGEDTATAFDRLDAGRRTNVYDLKREDAEQALLLIAAGLPAAPGAGLWAQEPWRTSFVPYWQAVFRPDKQSPGRGAFLALLQHQQLYDPAFPARWRARVLSTVAGRAGTPADPQRSASGPDPDATSLLVERMPGGRSTARGDHPREVSCGSGRQP